MESPTVTSSRARPWHRISRGDLLFGLTVLVVYLVATWIAIHWRHADPDRLMLVAESAVTGHLDNAALKDTTDSVAFGGRYYLAVGPLQLLPYLPFAFLHVLLGLSRYMIELAVAIPAAWLALPLARAYGARGATAYWIAAFTAFGTLFFFISVFGDFYYLAHAESFLALTLFLLEWAGRRRPALLGSCMAFSFLARPTTVLAAVPFGLVLLWRRRDAVVAALAFVLPVAVAIGIYGWFNWVRFGSPTEAGYALSYLPQPGIEPRRELGLFSLLQIPENLRLALLALPERLGHFPYFTASPYGLSMLLVSPALLASAWAGVRDARARLLWISAGLVAIPVFLYYGGGYVQYGFRYSLDFTPFLVALVALGSGRWIGRPERALILLSIASVSYGVLWHAITWLR